MLSSVAGGLSATLTLEFLLRPEEVLTATMANDPKAGMSLNVFTKGDFCSVHSLQSLSSSTVLSRQAASEMPVKVHLCGSTGTSNYSRGATLSLSCNTMTANFQPSFPLCSK